MPTPTPDDMLGMSDEDFSNLNAPLAETSAAVTVTETAAAEGEQIEVKEPVVETPAAGEEDTTPAGSETATDDESKTETATQTEGEKATTEGEKKPEEQADTTGSESASTSDKDKKSEETADNKSEETNTRSQTVDHKAFYDKVMAPFKANGKTITLKTPEEAIQLMQMGANYTRKLQELQPHRKIVMMLQNNDLLDEGKLSYLIDLDKKNPEAVKKLIKDSGLDPIEIDTEVEPDYKPGSHQVSDQEVNFRSVMDDIRSKPSGTETLTEIHSTWDEASKRILWTQPDIMAVIHEARETGVYAEITAEMDRQITLGMIPANTPFLEAYKTVGDAMVAATLQKNGGGQQAGATQEQSGVAAPQVIATRAATPKSPLANGDKAKAASPTRTVPKAAEVIKNPLAESDEDFLKKMAGRL